METAFTKSLVRRRGARQRGGASVPPRPYGVRSCRSLRWKARGRSASGIVSTYARLAALETPTIIPKDLAIGELVDKVFLAEYALRGADDIGERNSEDRKGAGPLESYLLLPASLSQHKATLFIANTQHCVLHM
eukprot:6177270-Pleurochrysis_carterae.AAC.1